MKKSILNLGTILNRAQLKQIKGGGTCAYYNGATGDVTYNLSKSMASQLSHPKDHWCCSGCGSASWYDQDAAMDAPD